MQCVQILADRKADLDTTDNEYVSTSAVLACLVCALVQVHRSALLHSLRHPLLLILTFRAVLLQWRPLRVTILVASWSA